jgi:hypothetical protein
MISCIDTYCCLRHCEWKTELIRRETADIVLYLELSAWLARLAAMAPRKAEDWTLIRACAKEQIHIAIPRDTRSSGHLMAY